MEIRYKEFNTECRGELDIMPEKTIECYSYTDVAEKLLELLKNVKLGYQLKITGIDIEMSMDEALVRRWKPTGLLEKCDDSTQELTLCLLLEEVVEKMDKDNVYLCSSIIPVITRIYNDLKTKNIDVERASEIFISFIPKIKELEKISCTNIDAEAEISWMCADEYIKEYKENEK